MARARDVEGLQAGDRFDVAAGRVVAVRAQELVQRAEGVLDVEDAERVRDMRVASRRLRAALEAFAPAFPAAAHAPLLRDVKALGDALGARRDPDVQLAAFVRLRAELAEPDRAALDPVIEQLRAEQASGNRVLAAALEQMRASDLPARLAALAADAMRRP